MSAADDEKLRPERSYVHSYDTILGDAFSRLLAAMVEKGVFDTYEAREIANPTPPPAPPEIRICVACRCKAVSYDDRSRAWLCSKHMQDMVVFGQLNP